MDRVNEDIATIVRREVEDYLRGGSYKSTGYFLENAENKIYAAIDVSDEDHPLIENPEIFMLARIVGDKVIIDCDITDRPLYEELLRCGIPREHIILAYAGEKVPPSQDEETEE